MWLMWLGVVLVVLKLAGLGYFAELSWWWIVTPLILAVIWFEIFEKRLGLDKKKAFDELERAKKERIEKAMGRDKKRMRR